jgi:hypothetical protein
MNELKGQRERWIRPRHKKLPETEELQSCVDEGLTKPEIADLYGWTVEAVRKALIAAGIVMPPTRQRLSHVRFRPWHVRSGHHDRYLSHRLRDASRAAQDARLPARRHSILK